MFGIEDAKDGGWPATAPHREQYVDLILVDCLLFQHSFHMLLDTVALTSQD